MSLTREELLTILDRARWAPSGDNIQPWKFQLLGEDRIRIHGLATPQVAIYDFGGLTARVAHGALLETLAIVAAARGYALKIESSSDHGPWVGAVHDTRLVPTTTEPRQHLDAHIEKRAVNRRPLPCTKLTAHERSELEASTGPGYTIRWVEPWRERLCFSKILYRSAKVRLTMPEAFEVHRSIMEWGRHYSNDRIPDYAVGLDPLTTRVMQWTMKSWSRQAFLNRWMMGTVLPRLQLDFMPGLCCGAHFVVCAKDAHRTNEDFVNAGRVLQRVWLTAESLGLQMQPEMTPLIFSWYVAEGKPFSVEPHALPRAMVVSKHLIKLLGREVMDNAVLMARIGRARPIKGRSLRKPLEQLLIP